MTSKGVFVMRSVSAACLVLSLSCTHTKTDETAKSPADQTAAAPMASKPSISKPFETLAWNEASPGSPLKVAVLWGNPGEGAYGMYLKMPAGFEAPMHFHTSDYRGILVAGRWEHWDAGQKKRTKLAPGSFVLQPGGAHHGDRCLKGADCVVLLVQDAKNDFIAVTKNKSKITPNKASTMIDVSKLKWAAVAPSSPMEASIIWGNPAQGAHGRFLRIPAGFDSGLHAHTGDYHAILISGLWQHWDAGGQPGDKLTPGSYVMQPGMGHHGDRCASDVPCVVAVIQNQPADYIPFKDETKAQVK